MNSKKYLISLTALAIIGAAVLSQVALSPSVSFIIGVISAALILHLSNPRAKQETADASATKTLYVGNLPYKANESNVRELFAKHGEVFAVRLMKDKRTGKRRGFGFVVMASADTENAISALNEQEYMQRTLKVRVANDPKHPDLESSQ